jgi:hypothetical protein
MQVEKRADVLFMDEASLDLWFPTHFAKNAKWMGHGAFVERPA